MSTPRDLPAVRVLRHTWNHQYIVDHDQVRWRTAAELPPAGERHDSPYDSDAHYGNKRSTTWTGYNVHVTETCDPAEVHLITRIATTAVQASDVAHTAPTHAYLAERAILPQEHLVDTEFIMAGWS